MERAREEALERAETRVQRQTTVSEVKSARNILFEKRQKKRKSILSISSISPISSIWPGHTAHILVCPGQNDEIGECDDIDKNDLRHLDIASYPCIFCF